MSKLGISLFLLCVSCRWGRDQDVNTPSDTSDSEGSVSLGSLDSGGTLFFLTTDVVMIVDDNVCAISIRSLVQNLFICITFALGGYAPGKFLRSIRYDLVDSIQFQYMKMMYAYGLTPFN